MTARQDRPDYGIDAPGVVRNLLFGGAVGLALWAAGTARSSTWAAGAA